VAQQLTLSSGVYPVVVRAAKNVDDMFDICIEAAKSSQFVKNNQLIVITAGIRTGVSGSTNLLKVHLVE
jgi:pyruvate kinase